MRIRIREKIVISFCLMVAVLFGVLYRSTRTAECHLQKAVNARSASHAHQVMKTLDQNISDKIDLLYAFAGRDSLARFVRASNADYSRQQDPTDRILAHERLHGDVPAEKLSALTGNPLGRELNNAFLKFFEDRYGTSPFLDAFVTNRYGINIAQVTRTGDLFQADETWWRNTRDYGRYISPVFYDPTLGDYIIEISLPVLNQNQGFMGAIKASLAISRVLKEVELFSDEFETTRIDLVTRDWRILYSSQPFRFMEPYDLPPVLAPIEAGENSFIADFGYRRMLVNHLGSAGFSRLAGFDWTLILQQNTAEVLAPIDALERWFVLYTAVFLGMGLVLSLVLSQALVRPIRRLQQAIARIGKGELTTAIDVRARDEIGELADAFRTMFSRLSAAQASIRQSEQKFRAIFNNTFQFSGMVTPDGRLIEANDASLAFIGGKASDVMGQNFWETPWWTQSPDMPAQVRAAVARAAKGEFVRFEAAYRPPDKSDFYFDFSLKPVLGEGGDILYLIAEARDITYLKQVEEKLRQARSYRDNVINSMPSALIGLDREGRIAEMNLGAEQMAKMGIDQARGERPAQVFPWLAAPLEKILVSLGAKGHASLEKVGVHGQDPDAGPVRYVNLTVYALKEIQEAVIRIDDVSEKVYLEEVMVQSEKMLSVGGLAAGMAHEINNPLAGMMQTADVVARRLTDMDMPANRRAAEAAGISMQDIRGFMDQRNIPRLLDGIKAAGQRAAEIVENMLSFARKSDAAVTPQDMADLVDRTLELAATDFNLKKQYDFKRIRIIREIQADLPMVPCERAKIQQVLLNLFRNGAQAMQDGGTVNHCPPCFIIRLKTRGRFLRMEIEDNGPGMSQAVQKRIFEPFFTTKPVGTGTGLGLSVSYFIITENHKGRMAVESLPGRGANFIISLPLALPA